MEISIDSIESISLATISEYNVAQIEYIKKNYSKERSKSKPVTFALQYFGTERTLVNNSGFTIEEATSIVANYKQLYKHSDDYKQMRLNEVAKIGYATVAFGLRVRTPILAKSILGNKKTPKEAESEARSVGNAMFQSYCMLTCRALNEFMERVYASEYKHDIMPVNIVHDALYLMIRDNIHVVKWVNDNLMDCMSWQELNEIKHDKVKLSAELGLFYPDWSNEITLPNNINRKQIKEIVLKSK